MSGPARKIATEPVAPGAHGSGATAVAGAVARVMSASAGPEPAVRFPATVRGNAANAVSDCAPLAVVVFERGQMIAVEKIGERPVEIGRMPSCDIRVQDPLVSRHHCMLRVSDGATWLTDLGSANGTHIDGVAVTMAAMLPGATATIGRVVLKFLQVGSPEWDVHCTQFRQIYTDEATGLLNRRGFRMRTEAWHAFACPGRSLGLLMLDIDHFKAINDLHGHLVGDAVIEHIASIIAAVAPANACSARLGGEEFGVFFNDCSPGQLQQVGEQIRIAVERTPTATDGITVAATVSVGGAMIDAGEQALRPMFVAADAALYEAKSGGRNRCVLRG